MDFYSNETLSTVTARFMQLGSKKKKSKLQQLTLSSETFSCKQHPAVGHRDERHGLRNKYFSDAESRE